MSLSDIVFNKAKGGLKRPLPGQDYISALIFYTATLPSGFTTQSNIRQFFQAADAVSAGVMNDYSDATAATGTYLITNAGAVGDAITITCKDINSTGNYPTDVNGNLLPPTQLCSYVKQTSDNTMTILGQSITAAINANTLTNGYSASFNTGTETITITAPKKFGVFLNTGSPLVVTVAGTIAGTLTQFSGGVFGPFAFYYYHISEFFRIQAGGNLYVGFFPIPGSYTFGEVNTIQNFSQGTLRQVGAYKDFGSSYNINDLTALSTACVNSDTVHKNLSALYGADMIGITDISTLADLSNLTANKASDCIGQDGGGQGNFLYKTSGKSVTCLGAELGAVALSKVSQSIAWVQNFNMSDGVELEEIAFANGQQYSSSAISDALLGELDGRRHIFLRKLVGEDGSYFNAGHTAISISSDYAFIEDNRTIDKAIRGVYSGLLPSLNGPLQFNSDGTLTEETIAALEQAVAPNLDAMVRAAELSNYQPFIDPTQLVLTTGYLTITVQLLQSGVARNIVVNIGYVTALSQ